MAAKYEITAAQKVEIEQTRAKNKDKKVEYKLKALSMRADGANAKKIGEATGYHPAYVSTLVSKYIHGGLEAITGNHYGGNRRNMSFEEEQEFLKPYGKNLIPESAPTQLFPDLFDWIHFRRIG